MFVALATVKLKSFICENAVQFRSERIGAREITRVMSAAQNGHSEWPWLPQAQGPSRWGKFLVGDLKSELKSHGRLGCLPP